MKKWYSFFIVIVLFFTFSNSSTLAADQKENYIIYLNDHIHETIIEDLSLDIIQEFDYIPALIINADDGVLQQLENDSAIKYIEKDQVVEILTLDPQWATTKINAPLAWNAGFTGKGIKIAVIDSGISRHDYLNIAGGISFVSGKNYDEDDHGHGTHVAGIIGAQNSRLGNHGVAPGAKLYAIKSMDSEGKGTLSSVIAGIEWSIENNIDIINMSIGISTHSRVFEEVINKAYHNGVLVVAAAGNSGFSADGNVMYPAKYESVIAVSAIDHNNERASFSSTGAEVELTAPGLNILSTNSQNDFEFMSGTSMATPFVTGTLALYMEKYPYLSHQELRKLLQKNAIDIGAAGRDPLFGYGIVQAPQSAAEPIGEPFETRLYVTESTDIYNSPSISTRASTISPQNVTTLRKWGDWYEINTWLGPKWIKPNAPLIGGIDRVSETIQLTQVTRIFTSPLASNHRSSLGAQTVTATHQWGEWYRINTWLGPMWLKPEKNDESQDFSEQLYITETTSIYQSPNATSAVSAISPQNVTTLTKWGDWYEINTWRGAMWIKPNNPLVGGVTRVSTTLRLTQVTMIYDSPLASQHRSSLGAQTVTATHKWNDWYQINTWLGPKWIKPSGN